MRTTDRENSTDRIRRGRGISVDIYDVLAVVGALAFAAGVGMIYVPAGIIVLGLSVLGLAVLAARSRARMKR